LYQVLGDAEVALCVAMTTTVLVGDKAQRWREELCLHEGRHFRKVEVASRAPESPGGRIIRARLTLACRMC
jgi:hypothetical protein